VFISFFHAGGRPEFLREISSAPQRFNQWKIEKVLIDFLRKKNKEKSLLWKLREKYSVFV